MNDKVSIWIGRFETEYKFNNFMEEQYNDDGDVFSVFIETFKIDYINSDFQEVLFQEQLSKNDLLQASYADSFIDKIDSEQIRLNNCIVLIYDFDYSGEVKSANGLNFVGTFEYNKNDRYR
jgi:hypothetical protein